MTLFRSMLGTIGAKHVAKLQETSVTNGAGHVVGAPTRLLVATHGGVFIIAGRTF